MKILSSFLPIGTLIIFSILSCQGFGGRHHTKLGTCNEPSGCLTREVNDHIYDPALFTKRIESANLNTEKRFDAKTFMKAFDDATCHSSFIIDDDNFEVKIVRGGDSLITVQYPVALIVGVMEANKPAYFHFYSVKAYNGYHADIIFTTEDDNKNPIGYYDVSFPPGKPPHPPYCN